MIAPAASSVMRTTPSLVATRMARPLGSIETSEMLPSGVRKAAEVDWLVEIVVIVRPEVLIV